MKSAPVDLDALSAHWRVAFNTAIASSQSNATAAARRCGGQGADLVVADLEELLDPALLV
jgi:hypothetical protein